MNQVAAARERQGFAKRLGDAIAATESSNRPGDVLGEFNRRAPLAPVTIFAVRKWLKGESIPTQDKLHVLAAWLGVSAHWLRFGDTDGQTDKGAWCSEALAPRERRLLSAILRLDEPARNVVEDVIDSLLHHLAPPAPQAPPFK